MQANCLENSGLVHGKIAPVVGHDLSDSSRIEFKERPRDTQNDEIERKEEDYSKMSKSEQKCHREKKRRRDINKGFDDLTALLIEIDPKVRVETQKRTNRIQYIRKTSDGVTELQQQEDNVFSRVDLISRTVDVLRRVHKENEERKQIIETLVDGKSTQTDAGIETDPITETSNDNLQHLTYTGP